MIDARTVAVLVGEYDGLKWVIGQADKIQVHQLQAAGSHGVSVATRSRLERLMGAALEQLATEELDRIRDEIEAMGARVNE